MSGRIPFRAAFSAILLVLAAGPGVARGWYGTGAAQPAGVSESPGVAAPWFVDEVDTEGDTGEYASVAYDAFQGAIYVSYYDATSHSLRIARDDRSINNCGPGGKWHCKTLDTSGADVGRYSSIAVRPAGSGMGIAYYDATNGHLKHLWFDNPHLWNHYIATIDKGISGVSTTGMYTSLKYTSADSPFIAYQFENPGGADALMLAYPRPDEGNCGYEHWEDDWQCDTIDVGDGVGRYASLALDGQDRPHIAYYDGGNGDLMYATSVIGTNCGPGIPGTWSCHRISGSDPAEDVGRYASIYIDGDDRFHIAYYNATTEKLMYATQADSGGNCGVANWARCDEIDDMPADYHPLGISIDEDPAGYPVIAYQALNTSLKLARPLTALGLPGGSGNCGPANPFSTWLCETIDRHGKYITYRNGDSVSLDVAPSGVAHIAYNGFIQNDSGNLRVAYQRFLVHLPVVLRNN